MTVCDGCKHLFDGIADFCPECARENDEIFEGAVMSKKHYLTFDGKELYEAVTEHPGSDWDRVDTDQLAAIVYQLQERIKALEEKLAIARATGGEK